MNDKDLERFMSKVKILDGEDPCWEWQASCNTGGYGTFHLQHRLSSSHRASYAHYKEEPGELHVLHRCDNPPCCNPDHLFLGTHQDNMKDRNSKEHASRALTRESVLQIKELLLTLGNVEIAKKHNVHPSTISDIRQGRTWSRVTGISKDNISNFKNPNTRCKLTESEVLEIVELLPTLGNTAIAKNYPVSRYNISSIRCGTSWSHITGIKKKEKS